MSGIMALLLTYMQIKGYFILFYSVTFWLHMPDYIRQFRIHTVKLFMTPAKETTFLPLCVC